MRLGDLPLAVTVSVVTGCCDTTTNGFVEIEASRDAELEQVAEAVRVITEDLGDEVHAGAADHVHRRGVLAELHDPSAAPVDAGKWTWANSLRRGGSTRRCLPETSPPIVCASGMFMYVAASAVAIVSNRSPTVMTISGLRRSNAVGSSAAQPVDFAIVPGVSLRSA